MLDAPQEPLWEEDVVDKHFSTNGVLALLRIIPIILRQKKHIRLRNYLLSYCWRRPFDWEFQRGPDYIAGLLALVFLRRMIQLRVLEYVRFDCQITCTPPFWS